jgi:hypothetical protein
VRVRLRVCMRVRERVRVRVRERVRAKAVWHFFGPVPDSTIVTE